MKDVQCYELFGGIALKNHAFSFSFFSLMYERLVGNHLNAKYLLFPETE